MRTNLEKQKIKVVSCTSGDDLAYLKWLNAEATYSNGYIYHIGDVPSASAFFEEIIHMRQAKLYGELVENDYIELAAREVAANRMLLKNSDAYKFTQNDYNEIKANLEKWEKDFFARVGVPYDESNFKREI